MAAGRGARQPCGGWIGTGIVGLRMKAELLAYGYINEPVDAQRRRVCDSGPSQTWSFHVSGQAVRSSPSATARARAVRLPHGGVVDFATTTSLQSDSAATSSYGDGPRLGARVGSGGGMMSALGRGRHPAPSISARAPAQRHRDVRTTTSARCASCGVSQRRRLPHRTVRAV